MSFMSLCVLWKYRYSAIETTSSAASFHAACRQWAERSIQTELASRSLLTQFGVVLQLWNRRQLGAIIVLEGRKTLPCHRYHLIRSRSLNTPVRSSYWSSPSPSLSGSPLPFYCSGLIIHAPMRLTCEVTRASDKGLAVQIMRIVDEQSDRLLTLPNKAAQCAFAVFRAEWES